MTIDRIEVLCYKSIGMIAKRSLGSQQRETLTMKVTISLQNPRSSAEEDLLAERLLLLWKDPTVQAAIGEEMEWAIQFSRTKRSSLVLPITVGFSDIPADMPNDCPFPITRTLEKAIAKVVEHILLPGKQAVIDINIQCGTDSYNRVSRTMASGNDHNRSQPPSRDGAVSIAS